MTDTVSNETIKTFADFDLDPRLCAALAESGISTPFPIQELTLPLALSGADLIGQARTGTGKTLAFGLPLLQNVDTERNATQALVIVPTRELCLQVHDDLVRAGAKKGVRVVAAYGGRAIDPQSEAIASGAEVVVGTPGRLLDLMRRGLLDLATATTLVLDEADEMLDMGFLPDVEQLIEACAPKRQTLLFSATMPGEVVALARRYMSKPTFMRADVEESRIAPETRQHFFAVHRMDKPAVVARILRTPQRGRCVIFTRTKRMADMLVKDLREAHVQAAAIHSDLRQEAREKTLARFRSGKVDVMCATEVAARGLDIDEVTHVINYDCPDDEKMYLHRIGRTGRAGAGGVAVTLAIWNELARLEMIKKALDITEPTAEVFSTSDLLDDLFPLPADDDERPATPAPAPAPAESRGNGRSGRTETGSRQRGRGGDHPRGRQPQQRDDERDGGDTEVRRRVRRRSRGEDTPGEATSGEATSAASTQQHADTDTSSTRTSDGSTAASGSDRPTEEAAGQRSRGRRRASDAHGSRPRGRTDTPAAEGVQDATSGEVRRRVRRRTAANDSSTPVARSSPTDRDTATDRGDGHAKDAGTARPDPAGEQDSAGKSAERQRTRSSGGGRRSRSSRRSRGPSSNRRRQADEAPVRAEHAEQAAAPDAATARGAGKPGLRRPFRIAHLP